MSEPLLLLRDVSVAFGRERPVKVTHEVSFEIFPGEVFALVGESGSGKSVTSMSILGLLPVPGAQVVSGEIFFGGRDLLKLSKRDLREVRGKQITCIFQEALAALNPVVKIRRQLEEALPSGEAPGRILELMKLARFADPDRVLEAYPHELSGGMLQRVCIVMALLPGPKLLIADEPTTALDVTVQAGVLNLLTDLSRQSNTAVLLITHNMGLVAQYAARVAVMHLGEIVETGDVRTVIGSPRHPYTSGLLNALPDGKTSVDELVPIEP